MNKPKRGNQALNISDNAECRCFEKLTTQQHHFLLKNMYPKDANPTSKMQHNASNAQLKQSINKKSLRKQKTRDYKKEQNVKTRLTYHEYYPANYKQFRAEKNQIRPPPLLSKQSSNQYRNAFRQSFNQQNQQCRSPLIKLASTQLMSPTFNIRQQVPTIPIRTIEINGPRFVQTQASPRVQYGLAEKVAYQMVPLTPRYKMQGIIPSNTISKEEKKNEPQIQKFETELNIKISQKKKIKEMKVLSDRSIKAKGFEIMPEDKEKYVIEEMKKKPQQKIAYYEEQPVKFSRKQSQFSQKPIFDKNKLVVPNFQSKIDPKKSCLDDGTGKSKIALKKVKNQKPRLSRMDDVQEIKSMIDSDQVMSDDDKESVVLGKLNEYGSLVDPTFSAVDKRPVTFMSKLAYQSTTAEKSMVKGYEFINYK